MMIGGYVSLLNEPWKLGGSTERTTFFLFKDFMPLNMPFNWNSRTFRVKTAKLIKINYKAGFRVEYIHVADFENIEGIPVLGSFYSITEKRQDFFSKMGFKSEYEFGLEMQKNRVFIGDSGAVFLFLYETE